jgi:integrase
MSKNANGEGSIYKRADGKGWIGQITLGRDPETGKLKRKTFYGKTQKEVQKKMSDVKVEINQGTFIETKLQMGDWMDSWLENYKKPPNVKLSTYVSYEMLIRQHVKPSLGKVLLTDLKPDMMQKFFNDKFSSGRVDGKGGLSSKTLRNIYNMLHECLKQAMINGHVNKNVCEAISVPKSTFEKDIKVLSNDEQQALLHAVEHERLRCAYYLLLGTGMRLGELLGLKWDCVDLDLGMIKIRQTLNRLKTLDSDSPTKTKLIFQTPKSASGKRDIPLTRNIINELIAHKSKQQAEKELAEGIYQDNNLVFCCALGTPIDPRSLIRNLHNLCGKNKLRRISVHSLRHTFATRLLEANQHPKVVQELLGHANISMTLDTYSHVLPNVKREAINTLDKLFDKEDDCK